jgi:hypothetical protein
MFSEVIDHGQLAPLFPVFSKENYYHGRRVWWSRAAHSMAAEKKKQREREKGFRVYMLHTLIH